MTCRQLVKEFARSFGHQTMQVRVYQEVPQGYVCEVEVIERDGSRSVQALPFQSLQPLRAFIECDPRYQAIRVESERLFAQLRAIPWGLRND